jgi:putative ABC transport system permease protein
MLWRGLPLASPERLVAVASIRADNANAPFTLPEFMDYRGRTESLSGLAAYANWTASLAGDGITERLTGARMSANAFEVLGASPAAGRLLTTDDDRPDAPLVVVLSYRLWQRRFGGSADVVGRVVRINSEPFVIAGVLPRQFPMPLPGVDIVTALRPDGDPLRHARGSVNFLRLFGRLKDAVSAAQAQAELTTICKALREQFPVEYARKDAVGITSLQELIVGNHRPAMLVLFAAVIVVLAVALANLTSLALVRAHGRRVELAMRAAIGASRWQLARLLTIDALVLVAGGMALGLIIARQAISLAVLTAPPSVPRLSEAGLDGRVLLAGIAVAAVVTLVLALAPMFALSRHNAGDALRASRGSTGDRWSHRLRNALVVSEIAAALMLVLAATVLIERLQQLQQLDPGFSTAGVFQARVALPPAYRSADDIARFYDRLHERLRAAPGVESAGLISVAPLSGLLRSVPFTAEGPPAGARDRVMANLRVISPEYLATVQTRLLSGRSFSESDRSGTPMVALVSASLADRFLDGQTAGKRLFINDTNDGPRAVEVVGIVDNVRHTALDQPPVFDVYLPLRQLHRDSTSFVGTTQFWMIKTGGDPAAFGATFISHLRAVDPDAAVSDAGSMQQHLDAWLGPHRFTLALLAAFALSAVVLAVSGLYGLVSYAVSQRGREIAVRLAVGATHSGVRRMILWHAARLAIIGAAAGVLATLATRPLVAAMLGDLRHNPLIVVLTAVALIAVVLVAAFMPARRVSRIEPTVALKAE